ncbi:MAG: ribonuclease E/G, partial [Pseudomonadota bacterium]
WETIRERTLESVAPCLIYEEASLIKRAIRDLYDKDTGEILVQGEEGYREAKDFMKMLMPSHAKNVQRYKGDIPVFLKHKVEEQLDQMYQPVVQLKSGGYLVIQQTEALVSIDVNSGKATKERNVEATALKTNSEAAQEVARQCRLRDLAGLIVIDFIDMEENRNNRAVEKKFKEAMKNDRARTQIGNISGFGLMEMSRQRRRSGIVDGTTQTCPVCDGAGAVRSHDVAAVRILRAAEGLAAQRKCGLISVKTSTDVALFILNTRRSWLERMEATYGVKTNVLADSSKFADQYEMAGSGTPSSAMTLRDTDGDDASPSDEEPTGSATDEQSDTQRTDDEAANDDKPKRRRRRRRRRGGESRSDEAEQSLEALDEERPREADEDADSAETTALEPAESNEVSADGDDGEGDGEPRRKRRRGRRGGRRNRRSKDGAESMETADASEAAETEPSDESDEDEVIADKGRPDHASEPLETVSAVLDDHDTGAPQSITSDETPDEASDEASDEAPDEVIAGDDAGALNSPVEDNPVVPLAATATASDTELNPGPKGPRRVGWWQRPFQK